MQLAPLSRRAVQGGVLAAASPTMGPAGHLRPLNGWAEDRSTRHSSLLHRRFVKSAECWCPDWQGEAGDEALIPQAFARTAAKAVFRLFAYSPHWRVGWRFVTDRDVWDRHDLGGTPWRVLPNAPFRFFADPFPVIWQGKTYIFFEDFDHRRDKGIISAVAFGPQGPCGDVFSVLEEPWHLSYPFNIEHDGELWMVPESSANRTVSLYRADNFPRRWVKEADLLTGIEASDATILRHESRFWMFVTVREGIGSFSEALHLFMSKELLGPWKAHPANPVLVDLRSARPAGNLVVRNSRLWRPVQDCHAAYGAALGLAEITCLNESGYEQVMRTVLRPGREWPGRRLHTLNRAGNLECIDGSALALRCTRIDHWMHGFSSWLHR